MTAHLQTTSTKVEQDIFGYTIISRRSVANPRIYSISEGKVVEGQGQELLLERADVTALFLPRAPVVVRLCG